MSMNYPDNDYRDYLEHSWGEWKQHKYLYKKGNRYYYPGDVGNQIKTAAMRTSQKVRTGIASLSSKNRDRIAYRQTGLTKRERDLAKARNDIGKMWAKNRRKQASAGVRGAVGSATTRAKNVLALLRGTNRERLAYRRTGMTAEQRAEERRKKSDVAKQQLQGRLHSVGTSARIAVGNTKARLRSARRNASNAASNAANKLQPKNINRAVYRKTGVDVGKSVSNARNRIAGAVSNLLKKRKKKN